jgi:hypothetical protein
MNGHGGDRRRQVQSPEAEFFVFGHPCYAAPEDNPAELDYIIRRYSDTGELVEDTPKRKCPGCCQYSTQRGQ